MGRVIKLSQLGLFLHGENNQNPAHIQFHIGLTPEDLTEVVDEPLEHRGGDFLYAMAGQEARYVRYSIMDNYGGSGSYTTKLFLFGQPV